MVARDPHRKVTLSAHPDFDGKKKGADRYGDAHVGSTVVTPDYEQPPDLPAVSGKSTSVKADRPKGKS